jgi:hypothetical protein
MEMRITLHPEESTDPKPQNWTMNLKRQRQESVSQQGHDMYAPATVAHA